jgi:hypothetical protein
VVPSLRRSWTEAFMVVLNDFRAISSPSFAQTLELFRRSTKAPELISAYCPKSRDIKLLGAPQVVKTSGLQSKLVALWPEHLAKRQRGIYFSTTRIINNNLSPFSLNNQCSLTRFLKGSPDKDITRLIPNRIPINGQNNVTR